MKKLMLVVVLAGGTLVAAAPPGQWRGASAGETATGGGYPACSRTVKDRCIQLYERGVATRANLALNERLGMHDGLAAMGGPYEAPNAGRHGSGYGHSSASRDDYPPCSREIQDRCIQLYERGVRGR